MKIQFASGVLLGILAYVDAAVRSDVDLSLFTSSSSNGIKYSGSSSGSLLGYFVSKGGDVNKDGIQDMLIGASGASFNASSFDLRPNCGITYVLFGSLTLDYTDVDFATFTSGAKGFRIIGSAAQEATGKALSNAGDINGDNFDDIIIGAPDSDPAVNLMNRMNAGAAYVIFGHNSSTPFFDVDLHDIAAGSSKGFRIIGGTAGDRAGVSVSGAGDINKDGVADLVVGASSALNYAGVVYVIFGRVSQTFANIDLNNFVSGTATGFTVIGATGGNTGWSVSRAGDFNNDGTPDIIIGAPKASPSGAPYAGAAYIIFGKATLSDIPLPQSSTSTTTFGCILTGPSSDSSFGYSVSAAGDVNGDMISDVIVGAYQSDSAKGAAFVFFGKAGAQQFQNINTASMTSESNMGFRIIGASAGDNLGLSVSSAGDVNGDGKSDVVIGAYLASPLGRVGAGTSYVLYGRTATTDINLANFVASQSSGFRIYGGTTGDKCGGAVSSAGDVNSDGVSDLLVASFTADPLGRANAGAVYVVFGSPPSPTSQPSSQPSGQPSRQPTAQPSRQPSSQPTTQPSRQPSRQPTSQPTSHPSRQPSRQPTSQPSSYPTHPTSHPTRQPSSQPSCRPTAQPSGHPSRQPSRQPTLQPTGRPSSQPSCHPTLQPSRQPSDQPSKQPSSIPSRQPTSAPTRQPSSQPSAQPISTPSQQPSGQPSRRPTSAPSAGPTSRPSSQPTGVPTARPSAEPTASPTCRPSAGPTSAPSSQPTVAPTSAPSGQPSARPSSLPTSIPTARPSAQPTSRPSCDPTSRPTGTPTAVPSATPTEDPTGQPTSVPSAAPSVAPSSVPTAAPTGRPSAPPSSRPSSRPSSQPSLQPTSVPTLQSTALPSGQPTVRPSAQPTNAPSAQPISSPTHEPTPLPTPSPTQLPTRVPTRAPTRKPSAAPTTGPSPSPSITPTVIPGRTQNPSKVPTAAPSLSQEALWRAELAEVLAAVPATANQSSAVSHRSTYYELDVATSSPSALYGSCSGWHSLLNSELATSRVQYTPSSIELTVQDSLSVDVAPSTVRCDSPSVVSNLLASLLNSTSAAGVKSSFVCSGHTWVVSKCAAGSSIPALCVDCADPCSAALHCSAGAGGSAAASTFSISPCVATTCGPKTSLVSGLRLFRVSYEDTVAAPAFLSRSVQSTTTSLTVTSVLSAPGTVYCAAYVLDAQSGVIPTPTSTSSIMLQNFVSGADATNTTVVTITGLQSATDFLVYCMSVSRTGSLQTLSDVLAQPLTPSTTCCIPIEVQTSSLSVRENQAAASFLTMVVNARPSIDVIAAVSVFDSSGRLVLPAPIFPTSFRINALSASTATYGMRSTMVTGSQQQNRIQTVTMTSSLLTLLTGNYTYAVTISGESVSQYNVTYGQSTRRISVLSSLAPLPAPVLTSATFADDGSYVAIAFDSNSDKGNTATQFTCSSLFSFSCASTSTCVWTSNRQVSAYVSSAVGCAAVNSPVTLSAAAKVQALCQPSATGGSCDTTAWPSASAATSVLITSSGSAVSPTVAISAPSTVGACDSLTLDLSGSSGNGGRPWLSRSIQVETSATANVTDLQSFLSHKYQASPPTPIRAALLSKGFSYNFVVTLCNFLGKCSQASKSVLALDWTIPSVSLPGAALRTTSRSFALAIGSDAYYVVCGGAAVRSGLAYAWTVSSGGALLLGSTSTSKDPSKFILAPYSLTVGATYTVSLSVTNTGTLLSAVAAVDVYVQPGNIYAVVAQGTSRTVRVQESITLDASASYDEDQPGVTGLRAGLVYSWSCAQVKPVYSSNCSAILAVTHSATGQPTYTLTALAGAESAVAQVSLFLLDAALVRSAETRITVTVTPSMSPVVTVSSNVAASGIFNSNRELQLTGTVSFPASFNGSAVWSVDDTSNFNFATAVKSPVSVRFPALSVVQASSTIYLVLAANTLPGRSTLTFSLTAVMSQGGVQTVASVAVAVNAPPLPGTFVVSPTNGTEIVEKFTFLADQWYDADLPLQYQFVYVSSSGVEVTVRSKLEVAFGSSTLPAGLSAKNFSVSCGVYVYDALAASSSSNRSVTVLKQTRDGPLSISTIITNGLAEAASDADSLKQATALGSYLLNEVDCSAAPDCAALNRDVCFRTANTCGECLSSTFVGDAGDSNHACVEIPVGSLPLTAFQACDSGGICVSVPKTCAGNCSYPQGSCVFVNSDTGAEVSTCFVGATDCNAVCDCQEDFIGSETCSLNSTQLLQKQALRSQVIQGIRDLVALEDPDQDTVAGWIGSVVDAAQAPDELSDESVAQLLDVATSITANAESIGSSPDDVLELLNGVNSAIQAVSSRQTLRRRRRLSGWRTTLDAPQANSSTLVLQTADVLHVFQEFLARTLLPGQDAVEFTYPQFRMFVQNAAVNAAGANVTAQLPMTSLERLSGLAASTVSLPVDDSNAAAQVTVLNISLSSMRAQLFNDDLELTGFDQLFSNPLSLKFSSISCNNPDCRFEITVQTSSMADGLSYTGPSAVHNTTCGKNDWSVHRYSCPEGRTLVVPCNGTAAVVMSQCPSTRYSPVCNAIAGLTIDSSDCRVESYTNKSVTCSCPVYSPARRALQANGTSSGAPFQEVSYVAMLSTVQKNFVSTIMSADDLSLSTIKKGWSALLTVGALAFAILYGLYWSYNADKEAEKVVPTQIKAHKLMRATSGIGAMKKAVSGRISSVRRADLWKKQREQEQAGNKDMLLAEQALPAILSSNSLKNRINDEIKLRHKWFGIIFNFSKSFPRVLRVLSLSTNMLIMLFIQSLTYSLTNPDDGECETLTTEQACLGPRSPYATGESKCYWQTSADVQCGVVEPNSSIKVILFVAVFSALISTPLALFVDWLLLHVLAAPTTISKSTDASVFPLGFGGAAEPRTMSRCLPWNWCRAAEPVLPVTSVVPSHDVPAVVLPARRQRGLTRLTSMARGGLVGMFGQTSDEQATAEAQDKMLAHADLRSLVEKIGKYRESLTPDQLVEFDAVWGLDEHGHFKTDEENQSKFRRCTNISGLFRSQSTTASTGSVSQRVLMDLIGVHSAIRAEEEAAVITDLTHKEKGKRLMFIFQRDLLPGISGKILESKGQRDNATAHHVSYEAKLAGWVFIGALNVGMLFYILLFALSESVERQGAWATSFALWLVVEILLVSSATVIFTHIFIPSLIMKDVNQIKSKLVESIRAFNINIKRRRDGDASSEEEEEKGANFSTTDYLFVSSRLAKKWSTLREAKIIAQFKTPWPKQSYQREVNVTSMYKKKFSFLTRSASILAMFFLTNLIVVPAGLQDMIISMVTTSAMGYTILLHVDLYKVFPVLVIIPTLIIAVIVHFFIQSSKASNKKALEKLLGEDKNTSERKMSSKKLAKIVPERRSTIILDERTNLGGELNMPLMAIPLSPFTSPVASRKVGAGAHTTRRESIKQGIQVLADLRRQQSSQLQNNAELEQELQKFASSAESDSRQPLSSSEMSSDDSGERDEDEDKESGAGSPRSHISSSSHRAVSLVRPQSVPPMAQVVTVSSVSLDAAETGSAKHCAVVMDAREEVPNLAKQPSPVRRWSGDVSLNSLEEEEMDALFDMLDDEDDEEGEEDTSADSHDGSSSDRDESHGDQGRRQFDHREHREHKASASASAASDNTDDLIDHFIR